MPLHSNNVALPILAYCGTAYALFAMKPVQMFAPDGTPKPFGLDTAAGQAPLPWYLCALLVAVLAMHFAQRNTAVPMIPYRYG